jgi:Ca2+-dependent lipid-binding protein
VPFGESRTAVDQVKEVNKIDTTLQKLPHVSDSKENIVSDQKDSRPTQAEQISVQPIPVETLPSRPISPESTSSRPISPQKLPSTPGTPIKVLSRPVSPGVEIQEHKVKQLEGTVRLTVHKAKKLPKKGLFGKADPYVKINLGQQNFKSPTIDNNLNPEWNYVVELKVAQDSSNIILLEVFDEDIGKDDAMGLVGIPVQEIVKSKKLTNKWFTLEKSKSGQVLISAEYVPTILKEQALKAASPVMMPKVTTPQESIDKEEKPFMPIPAPRQSLSPERIVKDKPEASVPIALEKTQLPEGSIQIIVSKAKDLYQAGPQGKADPYVLVTIGTQEFKSKTIKNNQNPEWNFDLTSKITKETADTALIEVFDQDIGKDDKLGVTEIDLKDIVESKNITNKWIPLQQCPSGQILISAKYSPITTTDSSVKVSETHETRSTVRKESSVKVSEIHETMSIVREDLKQEKTADTILIEKPKEEKKDDKIIEDKEPDVVIPKPEKSDAITIDVTKDTAITTSLEGTLHVTIYKAKNLEKTDFIGKSDPYAVIEFGKQSFSTKTVKNNQNPEWNYDVTLDITKDIPDTLQLEIWDEDVITKDDSMGTAEIDLVSILEAKTLTDMWVPLQNCKSGEVLISAHYLSPQNSAVIKDTAQKSKIRKEKSEDEEVEKEKVSKITKEEVVKDVKAADVQLPLQGIVQMTVHKARDLQKKGILGKADPYFIAMHGTKQYRSETIKNNQDPEWEYSMKLDTSKDDLDIISLEVFDEDFGKDDSLGIMQIDLREIAAAQNVTNRWIALEKCESGQVLISAEYLPQHPEKQEDTKPIKASPTDVIATTKKIIEEKVVERDQKILPPKANVILTIHKAKKLPKKGFLGKSDPYTIVTLDKQTFRTKTIKNNLNPEWNHEMVLEIYPDSKEVIMLEVFDDDTGKDDFIGKANIPIDAIVKARQLLNHWISLEGTKSGQILISAEYKKPITVPQNETKQSLSYVS